MKRLPFLFLLSALALWSCASGDETATEPVAPPPAVTAPSADEAAARAFSEAWDSAYQSGDADEMAAMFTEDAVRLAGDRPLQRGQETIRAQFVDTFAGASFETSNPVLEIQVAGDWAFGRGTFADKRTDDASGEVTEENGKWVTILRKTDDGWKYEVDAGNDNEPGEPGEALAGVSLPEAEDITTGSAEDIDAVRAAVGSWEAACEAVDADALAALFTQDAVLMPDDGSTVTGRDAIREYEAANTSASQECSLTLDVIEVTGDWAWIRGHWGVSSTDDSGSTTHDQGKYVNIANRTAEGWMITLNFWNRDAPPPLG